MKELNFYLADEQQTVLIGQAFGKLLVRASVVYLEGVLGAGKTTFCKGVLSSFGYSGKVKSPTYTLVEPYQVEDKNIFHFDLYRLGDPEELEFIGIRDYFTGDNIALIEWWQKGVGYIPNQDFNVQLEPKGEGRKLSIISTQESGTKVLKELSSLDLVKPLLC